MHQLEHVIISIRQISASLPTCSISVRMLPKLLHATIDIW